MNGSEIRIAALKAGTWRRQAVLFAMNAEAANSAAGAADFAREASEAAAHAQNAAEKAAADPDAGAWPHAVIWAQTEANSAALWAAAAAASAERILAASKAQEEPTK